MNNPAKVFPVVTFPVPANFKRTGIDLDSLQFAAGRLMMLLQDRQPGVEQWETNLDRSLESLRRITK